MESLGNPEATKGDAITVITENYKNANICADRNDSWIEFYDDLVKKERARNKK